MYPSYDSALSPTIPVPALPDLEYYFSVLASEYFFILSFNLSFRQGKQIL